MMRMRRIRRSRCLLKDFAEASLPLSQREWFCRVYAALRRAKDEQSAMMRYAHLCRRWRLSAQNEIMLMPAAVMPDA